MSSQQEIIEEVVDSKEADGSHSDNLITLYGHVNTAEKWWVLSRSKSTFIKNMRLLYVFGAVKANKPQRIQNPNEPSVGDVGNDIHGYMYELKEKRWA